MIYIGIIIYVTVIFGLIVELTKPYKHNNYLDIDMFETNSNWYNNW